MAEIVFPCSCGMLLKVHGDDQVGQGIVCPSCGSTAIVPAVGIAVDPDAPLFSDSPPGPPATSKASMWFGLVYLAGISAVTGGLIKFVLMPALATPPVAVVQAAPPADDKPDADNAPRRLLTKPRASSTEETVRPAAPAPPAKGGARSKPATRPPVAKSKGSGRPPGKVPRGPLGGIGGGGPGAGKAPAVPRGRTSTPDATPKTDVPTTPSKPSPRSDALASETGGPAKARRVSRDEMSAKSADTAAAKKTVKGQDPVARVKTLMNLAFNLEVQQNYEGALEYYREVTTKFPDAPEAKKAADRVRALIAK
jgi:hypothetical protein